MKNKIAKIGKIPAPFYEISFPQLLKELINICQVFFFSDKSEDANNIKPFAGKIVGLKLYVERYLDYKL